ncbi:hypothetical protein NDU88_000432 [Pleurodeles waltl]|uniref:Uncharacterized protein n=1 Tax=Pleurodeles waltl TaxID=8319 RepID=A0AAV7TFK1_PLEWA|nr:hypothetical protein NDU88_000432 [Pleurodeles waltl]
MPQQGPNPARRCGDIQKSGVVSESCHVESPWRARPRLTPAPACAPIDSRAGPPRVCVALTARVEAKTQARLAWSPKCRSRRSPQTATMKDALTQDRQAAVGLNLWAPALHPRCVSVPPSLRS